MTMSPVIDVLQIDRRRLILFVVGRIGFGDLGQLITELDARHFHPQHGLSVLCRQDGIFVRADRPGLRRPQHVDDPSHPTIVALDERARDFVQKVA